MVESDCERGLLGYGWLWKADVRFKGQQRVKIETGNLIYAQHAKVDFKELELVLESC